jgi:hypothetical protein
MINAPWVMRVMATRRELIVAIMPHFEKNQWSLATVSFFSSDSLCSAAKVGGAPR